MSALAFAALSDCGRVRSQNEDRWFADPEQGLFIVSDGMSLAGSGALAAQIVTATLPRLLRQELHGVTDLTMPTVRERVLASVCQLSEQLRRQTKDKPGLDGIGATVVLALVRDKHALITHLGDSRAYWWRNGQMKPLTKDHTLLQLLLDCGEIEPEEAKGHAARGQLTRYVGMKEAVLPEARLLNLEPGDRLLLCSDGLTSMIGDAEILAILNRREPLEEMCRQMVSATNDAGGKDDVTVVCIAYERA